MEVEQLQKERKLIYEHSKQNIQSLEKMIRFFLIFQENSQSIISKISKELSVLSDDYSEGYLSLTTNVNKLPLEYNNYLEKSKKITSKIEDLITISKTFYRNITRSYNDRLMKLDGIIKEIKKITIQNEHSKMSYYQTTFNTLKLGPNMNNSDILSEINEEIAQFELEKEKNKTQVALKKIFYKIEVNKYNELIKQYNKQYLEIIEGMNQAEESRIYFVKSIMDKYKSIIEEYQANLNEYSSTVALLISPPICENEIKKVKEFFGKYTEQGKKPRIENKSFLSFDEFVNENKDKMNANTFTSTLKPNQFIKVNLTEEAQTKLINRFINEILEQKDLDSVLIGDILEALNNENNVGIYKRFLDALLERKKVFSIIIPNFNNLQYLSHIICYISLSQSSIFQGSFELNFKIIFIAENIYYQNKKDNSKVYLCSLLSKSKYFRSKCFWKDVMELKLSNKLQDHIINLKNLKIQGTKSNLFMSSIGKAFGIKNESQMNSLVFNSRISKLIKNLNSLEFHKIPFLDQIATKEMSKIIKECIPSFVNFNFPSEQSLDLIANLTELYKIPKETINYYVTYFHVSSKSIRKNIPNKNNNNYKKIHKYQKVNDEGCNIICQFLSYTLKYISKKDYINLLVLSKEINEKISKRIYKIVLGETTDNQIRLKIWQNILKIKEIKKKYDYKSILKASTEPKIITSIEMDVLRTYVGVTENSKLVKEKIKNILLAIAISNGDIQYCQGMNYIAEFIFEVTNDEEEAFYIFLGIFLSTEYPLIFEKDLEKLKVFFYVFKRLVSLFEPELFSYFNSNSVEVNYFVPSWFITLFLSARQYNRVKDPPLVLLRIIDSFLISGWKALIKIGIEVLHSYELDIMKLKNEEMMQFLNTDMLKYDFFTTKNLEKIKKCLGDKKIDNSLIKNIELEYAQEEKLKQREEKN